tara:strand:+ start:685 stop:1107 length:423 start_codon:yes stop_codon:yes gene_type:complete
MEKKLLQEKILIIHGPNLNLIGHKNFLSNENITLDKINKNLRTNANLYNYKLKIFQTNSESKAVNILQRNRNKVFNIIIFPGAWQEGGYVLKDTLHLLGIPFITISTGEKVNILDGIKNFNEKNIYKSIEKAIHYSSTNQ